MIRRRDCWLLCLVILFTGIMLRLYQTQTMQFEVDEGVNAIYAVQLVENGEIPLKGVLTSVGFYNPPTFNFLIAPAFLLSSSPRVAVLWLSLLSLAACGYVAWQFIRMRLPVVALGMCVLWASAPGVIFSTTRLWGHAVIGPQVLCLLGAFLALARAPRAAFASALLPAAGLVGWASHFSGAIPACAALFVILFARIRIHKSAFCAGIVLGLIPALPYLHHLKATQFADIDTIWNVMVGNRVGDGTPTISRTDFRNAVLFAAGDWGSHTMLEHKWAEFQAGRPWLAGVRWVTAILVGLLIVSALSKWQRCVRRRGLRRFLPVVIFGGVNCVATIGLFSVLPVVPVAAYALPFVPILFMLTACGLQNVVGRARNSRAVTMLLCVITIIVQTVIVWTYNDAYRRTPDAFAYASFADQDRAARRVAELIREDSTRSVWQEDRDPEAGIDFPVQYLVARHLGFDHPFRVAPPNTQHETLVFHSRAKRTIPLGFGQVESLERFGLIEIHRMWKK